MIYEMSNSNLSFILKTLLDERADYADIAIPYSQHEQRELMRSLLNVRPPLPVSDAFCVAQDAELLEQRAEKGIVYCNETQISGIDNRLRLWQGDITRLEVDAIVNAANSSLLGCFVPLHRCIDNAIHSAAGVQLRLECHRLMQEQGSEELTGSAKITKGYYLPVRYVIHTVGPIIQTPRPTPVQEQELASCYRSCLEIAAENRLESIAFCCISTGEFRFPQRLAAEIAVETVRDYLNSNPSSLNTVVFNVFKDDDLMIYKELLDV